MALWRPFECETVADEFVISDCDEEIDVVRLNYSDSDIEQTIENEDRKRHHLPVEAQQIILNVYKNIKLENTVGVNNYGVIKRVTELTEVPYRTVCRIIRRGSVKERKKSTSTILAKIDSATRESIRDVIYDFYKNNSVPTVENVFQQINQKYLFPYKSMETLRQLMIDMGFRYKIIDKRQYVMDSERIVRLRHEYLSKIESYRQENRSIVWLDETWFDTHDIVKKGWTDSTKKTVLDAPPSRGKRIIIIHAGSENGFINGCLKLSAKSFKSSCADYHQDMNAEMFENWFCEHLLPNIPKNSVIVMDNASYHSRQLQKIPNKSTKKADIITFLQTNNIHIPDTAKTKEQLLKFLDGKNLQKTYFIDETALKNGHCVLRLPPYYCEFNPIEIMWSLLKSTVRKRNTSPRISDSVLRLIKDIVPEIDKHWNNCVQHVLKVEKKYTPIYNVKPLIITTGSDSSSEFSESSDSS